MTSDEDDAPSGTQWDGDNYSCAYDALFAILFNIWKSNPKKWKKIFKDSNEYVSTLHLWEWAIALHGRVLVPFCYW